MEKLAFGNERKVRRGFSVFPFFAFCFLFFVFQT